MSPIEWSYPTDRLAPYLYAVVKGRPDGSPHGPVLAQWLDEARRLVFSPILGEVFGPGVEWPWPDAASNGDRSLEVSLTGWHGSRRIRAVGADANGWAKLLDRVRSDEIDELRYGVMTSLPLTGVVNLFSTGSRAAGTWAASVQVDIPLLGGRVARHLQDGLVDLLCDLARSCHAITGRMDVEHPVVGPTFDPDFDEHELHDLGTQVEGFRWGTFLSAGHIARLGGRAAIASAPVHRVVDCSTPDHDLVFLELTSDINAISEEEDERLRAFLRPVVPVATGPIVPGFVAVKRGRSASEAERVWPPAGWDDAAPEPFGHLGMDPRDYPDMQSFVGEFAQRYQVVMQAQKAWPTDQMSEPTELPTVVADIPVDFVGEFSLDPLFFTLVADRPLSDAEHEGVERFLDELYDEFAEDQPGSNHDHLSYGSDTTYGHAEDLDAETIEWSYDAAQLGADSLERLIQRIATYAAQNLPVQRLLVGDRD